MPPALPALPPAAARAACAAARAAARDAQNTLLEEMLNALQPRGVLTNG